MVIRVTSSRGYKMISGEPVTFNELKRAVNEILRGHIESDVKWNLKHAIAYGFVDGDLQYVD